MKKINWRSFMLLAFISIQANADTSGLLSCDRKTIAEIAHEGFVDIKNSTVKGKVQVEGRLTLVKSQLDDELTVEGRAELNEVNVTGTSSFKGVATLQKSQLKGDVYIKGDQGSSIHDSALSSQLNFIGNELTIVGKSVLHSINIVQSPEHPEEPVLIVGSGVTIEGDIFFQSLKGKVKLATGTKLKGKVVNGEIVR